MKNSRVGRKTPNKQTNKQTRLTGAVEVVHTGLGLDVVKVVLVTVVTQAVPVPPAVTTRHAARVPAPPLR